MTIHGMDPCLMLLAQALAKHAPCHSLAFLLVAAGQDTK